MVGALLYLKAMSLRNWVRWRLQRLRQPKYLVGTLAAVAYFYFFFFRRAGVSHRLPAHVTHRGIAAGATTLPVEWYPVALAIGALALAVILALMWIVPTKRAALGFLEAEIAFLFPAPVTRRALVHFRLLASQLRSLTAGLIMAVFSNRWTFLGGNAVTHALGWWFIFSALNLHFSGSTFTLTRIADRGLGVVWRRLAVLVAFTAVAGVSVWRLAHAGIGATSRDAFAPLTDWIVALTTTAPLSWLLYPLRLVLAPFLAPDMRAFALALGPALLVLAVHYLWVVRTAVSFEEASIEHAHRRAAKVAAWRSGERRFGRAPTRGRAAPFALANRGRPEIAFLWKNLLSAWPYFTVRVFGWCALAVVGLAAWARHVPTVRPIAAAAGVIGLFSSVYILIMGPQFARQDIRGDFNRIDTLKTYPLAGWQIVLGEILAPAAILTGIVWLALLTAVMNADAVAMLPAASGGFRFVGGLTVAAVIPLLVVLQLVVPNAAALLFPSWAEATRTRGGGIEVMGQRMIYFLAQLVTMVVVLLPAGLVGWVVIAIVQWLAGATLAIAAAAVPILAVLLGEIVLAIWWLGRRFERIDISAELRS